MTKTKMVEEFISKTKEELTQFHAVLETQFTKYGDTDTGDAGLALTSESGKRLEVVLEWDDPAYGKDALYGFSAYTPTNTSWYDDKQLEPVLNKLGERLRAFAKNGKIH